jgi:hypothetical protein
MSSLLDKLKAPEFDESKAVEIARDNPHWATQRDINFYVSGMRDQHSLLTKEIEKRNRVIEKLIEQRDSCIKGNCGQKYDSAARASIKVCDETLLSIIEGV